MGWTNVLCNNQLHSEPQTIYYLMVKKSHLSKLHNHIASDMWENMLFYSHRGIWITAAEINPLLFIMPGRSIKIHSQTNFVFPKKLRSQALRIPLSGLQSRTMFQLKGYEEERWEKKWETELFKDVSIHNESLKSRPGFSLLEL